MKKVQLYSGGMDSYIINKLWKPDVKLYINYGIPQNIEEMKHLPEDVIIKDFDLSEYLEDDGLNTIPLRNLILSAIAVNYGDEILIGGLADDVHYDKTEEFAKATTKLFNSVLNNEKSHKNCKVVVPFRKYTKEELVRLFKESGGTKEELMEKSWSCHTPNGDKECGKCFACQRKLSTIKKVYGDV